MTPVEERIDHDHNSTIERALVMAEIYERQHNSGSQARVTAAARKKVRDLLTEHSAREEREKTLKTALIKVGNHAHGLPASESAAWIIAAVNRALAAFPATESAQPEEDRTEAWIHSPERESPPVKAEEEG